MLRLRQTILQTSHHLQRLLIQNTLMGFFIEMGNIFSERKEYNTPPSLTRKEELFESFLRILYMYCKEQHVVSFYAEQLYITPQYLSLILKELTGRSANKWIDEALMQEAKILLKAPQATVYIISFTELIPVYQFIGSVKESGNAEDRKRVCHNIHRIYQNHDSDKQNQ